MQNPKASTTNAKPSGSEVNYTDTLPAELQQDAKKIFSYSVSVENESGRSAGLSNHVQIPAALTLPAPADFKAQLQPMAWLYVGLRSLLRPSSTVLFAFIANRKAVPPVWWPGNSPSIRLRLSLSTMD